jgi:hypothetical protein
MPILPSVSLPGQKRSWTEPLRFLLADDPGAGKTIMSGLYVHKLAIRGDAERDRVPPEPAPAGGTASFLVSTTEQGNISGHAVPERVVGLAGSADVPPAAWLN